MNRKEFCCHSLQGYALRSMAATENKGQNPPYTTPFSVLTIQATLVLDAYLFESLDDVREITERWIDEYNEQRPHDSLKGLPEAMYREMITREVSLCEVST